MRLIDLLTSDPSIPETFFNTACVEPSELEIGVCLVGSKKEYFWGSLPLWEIEKDLKDNWALLTIYVLCLMLMDEVSDNSFSVLYLVHEYLNAQFSYTNEQW